MASFYNGTMYVIPGGIKTLLEIYLKARVTKHKRINYFDYKTTEMYNL